MKIVCDKCNYEKVDIMSVSEDIKIINNKKTPMAKITFICSQCGNGEIRKELLYRR